MFQQSFKIIFSNKKLHTNHSHSNPSSRTPFLSSNGNLKSNLLSNRKQLFYNIWIQLFHLSQINFRHWLALLCIFQNRLLHTLLRLLPSFHREHCFHNRLRLHQPWRYFLSRHQNRSENLLVTFVFIYLELFIYNVIYGDRLYFRIYFWRFSFWFGF